MKLYVIFAAGAALGLAACGGTASNEVAANDAAPPAENIVLPADENVAAPAPAGNETAAATPAAGAAPTREFVVGRWGDSGDCTLAIDFRADGTTDGPFGNWTLEGNRLSMADNPQVMTVTVIDQNTMESRLEGGPPRRMTRC